MHSTKLLTWCLASLSLVLATPDLPNKEILKRQVFDEPHHHPIHRD